MIAHIASSASPVGSEIFASIALVVISLIVLLVLRYYLPLRTTPAYLLVPVFFALWLPAFIVLLVPIDLASSAAVESEEARGVWFPERLLLVSWRITYWLTFVLTWFILPILAEYSDAGYREPKDRILYALRETAQYHAIVFGSGVVGLVYVFVSHGVRPESLKGLVMALAYCWGLVFAIYLMGHGLVAIPRALIRKASFSGRLRRLQGNAPKLYEKMEDSLLTLEDLEIQVSELSKRKTGSAREHQDWIEELTEMCNAPEARVPSSSIPRASGDSRILPTVITEKYLADVTRKLVRARHARSRYVDEWNGLLQEASKVQTILDSAGSKKLDFGSVSPEASLLERLPIFTPYTRFLVHFYIIPSLRIGFAAILAVASIFIIWSEMVKTVLPDLSIIRLSVVHHWKDDVGQVGFAGQVIAALWIMYMCTAALASVTEVKVWRGRALVKRNTAHESAFWYASQVARLSVPLSYNFMTFLSPTIYEKTTFYSFLGVLIDLTPLGKWFDNLFPILVLIPVCATLFGLYGKVKRFFGFDMELVDDDEENETGYGTGSWREGRDLIERELNGTSISRRREDLLASRAPASSRTAPILSVPGASSRAAAAAADGGRGGARTPFATSPDNHHSTASSGAQSSSSRSARDPPPEDEGFFSNFGHRIMNTMDTLDTPKFFQDIGNSFKKPKWMGGSNDDGPSAGGSSSSNRPAAGGRSNSDVRRWFGGGGDGRIRL